MRFFHAAAIRKSKSERNVRKKLVKKHGKAIWQWRCLMQQLFGKETRKRVAEKKVRHAAAIRKRNWEEQFRKEAA